MSIDVLRIASAISSKMADGKKSEQFCSENPQITFCVSVNLKKGDTKSSVISNAIRKFSTQHTWYDVFDICTENDESIPKNCFDNFEKLSTVSVSSKLSASAMEQYRPKAFKQICRHLLF